MLHWVSQNLDELDSITDQELKNNNKKAHLL